MRRVFLWMGLTLLALTATARDITGRVMDERSLPLSFASVTLLDTSDSAVIAGTLSKEDGTFTIRTDHAGGLLEVSCVGYQTRRIAIRQDSVGDIQLRPDTLALAELVVKGHRPIIRREHEKTIFDLKHMPRIEALKAMDVMKFAPGVVVTSTGDINVAGKSAAVFVNDRQLTGEELTSYLNSLRASDIERIEVTRNHGGVNDASIEGGVVNIITKRNILGVNGSADCYASTPASGYYDLSPTANFFLGTGRWNLYATYSYTQGRGRQYNETTNDYRYNGTRHDSEGNFYSFRKRRVYRLGLMYNLSPRHTLGVELNGVSAPPTTSGALSAQTYTIGGQPYQGDTRQANASHSDFYNVVGSYRWDIDDRKSILKCLLNYNNKNSMSDNTLQTRYATLSGYDVDETDLTLADGDNWSSTLDFRKNCAHGWSLRLGGKMMVSDRGSLFSSADHLLGTESHTDWDYRESIYGGYLGASKEMGRWYVYANLRVEHTSVKGQAEEGERTRKRYTDWFPYLYVSYATSGKYDYALSYSRTIYRPPFSLMNGYVNRMSDVLYDKGNPDLQAELTDVCDFTVSRGGHSLSLVYRHKPHAITEWFEVEDGITYHTNVNSGSVSSVDLSYAYSGNLLAWWQTNVYVDGSYTRVPKSYNKSHLLGGVVSWNNRLSWEKVGAISLGLYAMSPVISGNAYQKAFASVDLSVEKSFLKHALTLQVGVNDLFNGVKARVNNQVPTLRYDVYLKNQTRQVWCRLTYTFSTKTKANKNTIQNDNAIKNRL